jgi:hypothetical protein
MLSNSQALFSEISRALYRTGAFVSYADLTGGKKAWKAEMQALSFLMQLLQKQNAETSFLHGLAKLASGELDDVDFFMPPSEDELESIRLDLENVPFEVERAVRLVVNNFPKSDARLYTDILVSAGACVAQAYDEKDDMFLTDSWFVDVVTFLTNIRPFFHRLLMFFSNLHADENAKYLYEDNDIFDQMKISSDETVALGQISHAVRKVWFEKYPEDREQSVQDYIREKEESC